MFTRILNWLKGVMAKMLNTRDGAKVAGGVPIAVSSEMATAIQRWRDEYIGRAYWLSKNPQSLKLPALIASEMATLVTLEAKITVSGSPRADWLMQQFEPVLTNLRTNVEYACAMGGIVMKPYRDGDNIAVDYIHADDFYPVAFNSRGEITSALFVERKTAGQVVYSRVEHHIIEDGHYTIRNRCYRGYSADDVGTEVSLSEVDEWRDIEPETGIEGIDFPLFAYFRIPLGNSVDPKSPLGVSVYSKAEDNIKEADFQYQRLLWEFKGGELAIDVSEDALCHDARNQPIYPEGKERLFRKNELQVNANGSTGKGVFDVFSPTLRDASYKAGLNTILAKIEDQTGLARGTLSDLVNDARTATEIKMNRQRTYATVTAIQISLQGALEALVKAMDTTASLYAMQPMGTFNLSCVWDDSVITDADTERVLDMQEIRDGIMQKWEYRVKWYGEDEATAKLMTQEPMTDDEIMGFDKSTKGNQSSKGEQDERPEKTDKNGGNNHG